MSIAKSEYSCSENFLLIIDIQGILFSCVRGVSIMVELLTLTNLGMCKGCFYNGRVVNINTFGDGLRTMGHPYKKFSM